MNQIAGQCHACGFTNPVENKFCAQCGAALEAPRNAAGEQGVKAGAERNTPTPLSERDQLKKEAWERRIAGYENLFKLLPAIQKGLMFITLACGLGLLVLLAGGASLTDPFASSTNTIAFFLLFLFVYFILATLYAFLFLKRSYVTIIARLRKKIEALYPQQPAKISPAGQTTAEGTAPAKKQPGLKSLLLAAFSILLAALLLAEIVPLAINTINPSAHVKAPVHIITSLVNKFTGGAFKVGRCAQIPMTNIRYDWCNRSEKPPSSVDSDYVWCQFSSDQVPAGGHGFFPPECTPF